MAVNSQLLRRPSDRGIFLITAAIFPLVVLIGYFKSYYFSSFFSDARPLANTLVHAHALVMSAWVIYFVAQVALIRTKNVKLHMSMGFAGIALATLVVVVGMATAYDSVLVRKSAPPGASPFGFFILPFSDMLLFVVLFAGAIYFRKKPAEHKSLMFLTAVNFMPAALFRIPIVPPDFAIIWAFGVPSLFAIGALIWHSVKHRKINKVFAFGVALLLIAIPVRLVLLDSPAWQALVASFAP